MRKSACILAILGLGASCVNAQVTPSLAADKNPPKSTLTFISAQSPEEAKESAPITLPTPIPSFYDQKIGQAEQDLKLAPVAAEVAEPSKSVIQQAEFQVDPASGDAVITPVGADLGEARPFPNRSPQAVTAPTDAAPTTSPQTSPVSATSEAKPVPTPPLPTVTDPATKLIGSGNLTISRVPEHREKIAPHGATAPIAPATITTPGIFASKDLQGPQSPTLTIEWRKQSEINVGQPFDCDLIVRNDGLTSAAKVELEAHLPQNVRVLDTTPKPTVSETFLGWEFAELKPSEERVIRITMLPFQRGALAARADVRFSGTASGLFEVAEPLLALSIEGPQDVMVGENIPQTVVISNPGTGVAANVRIEAIIPNGLKHVRGERLLMEIGSLNPGESRRVRLALAAASGGQHRVLVHAIADHGLDRQTTSTVNVVAPILTASVQGPRLRYLGREGLFKLVVKNDGKAATNNVQLMHKIPDGFRFLSADRGVQYDRDAKMLSWFVGRLAQGQTAELTVKLSAEQAGEFKHLIRATSEHGSLADAELDCRIEGVSSLSVEVVDLDDPVETGTDAIYEVRVKNEGTAPAKGVAIACELAPGMIFQSAQGPAEFVQEGQFIKFRPSPELGPDETSLYRVHVSSKTSGSMRFRARVTSDSVSEPLTSDELTKFYGE